MAFLGRFAGSHAILLGGGQPKTPVGTFFSIIVLSQPVVMAFRVTKVALLKGRQIAQIQNGIFQGVHNKKL